MNDDDTVNLKLENNQRAKVVNHMNPRELLSGTKAIAEEKETLKQSSKADDKDEDIEKLYEKVMRVLAFGLFMGYRFRFSWEFKRQVVDWFYAFSLTYTWVTIIHAIYTHYINEDYALIVEPLAIVGLLSSVIQKLLMN